MSTNRCWTCLILVVALVACGGPVGDAPGAPADLQARSLDGGLDLQWIVGDPGSSAVTNHAYSLDDGASWRPFAPAVTGGAAVVAGLVNGEVHRVRVRAVNARGPGPSSDAVDAVAAVPAFLVGLHGTEAEDEIRIKRLAPTHDGGVLVVGELHARVAFGDLPFTTASHGDVGFVAKLDADGTWAWRVDLASGGSAWVEDVVALADGGAVVTGAFRDSLDLAAAGLHPQLDGRFIAGLDADGAWTWSISFEQTGAATSVSVRSIAVAPDGDVVLVGSYRGVIEIGPFSTPDTTTTDLFVARVSPAGTWRWLRTAGSDALTYGERTTVLADGTIVVTGFTMAAVPLAAQPDLTVPAGQSHILVAALDADGAWRWARSFGNPFSTSTNSVVVVGDAVLAVGTIVGTVDFGPLGGHASPFGGEAGYLVTFGSDGAWHNVRVLAASENGSVTAAAARPGGGAYLAGRFRGDVRMDDVSVTTAFEGPFVAAIDGAGALLGWRELAEVEHPLGDGISAAVESDAIAVVGGIPVVAGYLAYGGMTDGATVVMRDVVRDRDDAFVWKAGHESTW